MLSLGARLLVWLRAGPGRRYTDAMRLSHFNALCRDAEQGSARLLTRLQAMAPQARSEALQATDEWDNSLLSLAAMAPPQAGLVQQLLQLGANVNHPGRFGCRPRLDAAACGQLENAALLAAWGGTAELGPLGERDWRLYLSAVMGLDGTTSVRGVIYKLSICAAEGVFAPMAEAFADFCRHTPSLPAAAAASIEHALRTAPLLLEYSPAAIAAYVAAGNPALLPSGWAGHATTHAMLDQSVVYSDRCAWVRTLRAMQVDNAADQEAVVRAAVQLRNNNRWLTPARLTCLSMKHLMQRRQPLHQALRRFACKRQHVGNCTVASVKAGVLALLLMYAQRQDAALHSAAHCHAQFKSFTTHLRCHALHAYVAQHLPGDAANPPDFCLIARARARLLRRGRLDSLPAAQEALEADRRALQAAWPNAPE